MKKCASTKRHFDTRAEAEKRLEQIQRMPLDPDRLYTPTGVVTCHCGKFALTSSHGKPGRAGKSRRDRRVR